MVLVDDPLEGAAIAGFVFLYLHRDVGFGTALVQMRIPPSIY